MRITVEATEPGRLMRTECPDCKWDIDGRVIRGFKPCAVCAVTTLHDSHTDIKGDKWVHPETPTRCFRCDKDMRKVAYFGTDGFSQFKDETDNECTMMFNGGYGSFIDAMGELPTVTICHECGHELCDWLGIDPRLWHTHSGWAPNADFPGQHPDHHDNRIER